MTSSGAGTSHSGIAISGSFASTPSRHDTSRATPHIDSQSGRFGVTSTSICVSPGKSRSSGTPTSVSAGKIISPELSSDSPSSAALHIMPFDSTPRSLDFLILNSPSGVVKTVPMVASGTMHPASQFGAPQTICSVDLPSKTWQTDRWSLSGWGLRSRIFAVITPAGTRRADSTASTSMPDMVSLWHKVASSQSSAT